VTTEIRDIPILINDDVVYLYIGSTVIPQKDSEPHTWTNVSLSWLKNLPSS
jgi:hypothetical protein